MRHHDVAVVGLGVLGAMTLRALAKAGASAVGLEARRPSNLRGSSHGGTRLLRRVDGRGPAYTAIATDALAGYRALEAEVETSLFTPSGFLTVAARASGLVSSLHAGGVAAGVAVERLSRAEVHARFPLVLPDEDAEGLFEPEAGYLACEASVEAALASARRAGAEVALEDAVVDVREHGDHVEVRTHTSVVRAERVVVAVGPWLPRFIPALARYLVVLRVPQGWFRPRGETAALRGAPALYVDGQLGRIYGSPDGDGSLLKLGGRDVPGPVADVDALGPLDDAHYAEVSAVVARSLPLFDPRPVRSEPCLATYTPDEAFLLDFAPETRRVVVLGGCSGHAFKHAPVLGERAARLVTGVTPDADAIFRIDRFERQG